MTIILGMLKEKIVPIVIKLTLVIVGVLVIYLFIENEVTQEYLTYDVGVKINPNYKQEFEKLVDRNISDKGEVGSVIPTQLGEPLLLPSEDVLAKKAFSHMDYTMNSSTSIAYRYVHNPPSSYDEVKYPHFKPYVQAGMFYTDDKGFRRVGTGDDVNDYYVVAMGSYYTQTQGGRTFRVTLENGTKFNCIIGELKAAEDTTGFMYHTVDSSVVEFLVNQKGKGEGAKFEGSVRGNKPEFNSEIVEIVEVYDESLYGSNGVLRGLDDIPAQRNINKLSGLSDAYKPISKWLRPEAHTEQFYRDESFVYNGGE